MNFIPKQHLHLGNYVKYIDEILYKCDKGIEYCKLCPNEFVCSTLEQDDFGLAGTTISDVLTAIQNALSRIPGYLKPEKRNELKEHIKRYINESPVQDRSLWEDSILNMLIDNKLSDQSYKPKAKISEIRILFTYNAKISFSTSLTCLLSENADIRSSSTATFHREIVSNSTKAVNQYIKAKNLNIAIPDRMVHIKYCLEKDGIEILERCNPNDAGIAVALCYYALLTQSFIPENIAVTGGLDSQGNTMRVDFLDSKIETILRELHFIDKIIIPKNYPFSIPVPENTSIIEASDLEQAINIVFR